MRELARERDLQRVIGGAVVVRDQADRGEGARARGVAVRVRAPLIRIAGRRARTVDGRDWLR